MDIHELVNGQELFSKTINILAYLTSYNLDGIHMLFLYQNNDLFVCSNGSANSSSIPADRTWHISRPR